MNATTCINSANNFANCNNHIEPNFGSTKSNSNNNTYKRIPTVTTTTKTTTLTYCNNNLPLQQTASNGIVAGQQQQQQRSPAPTETATSRECSSVAYSTLTTMRLVEAKESCATVAGNGEEARTKLMPTTAIKIISINNSKSNNNNPKAHKHVSSNNKNSHNYNNIVDNNINKSTTKSTGTTGAKLDSSMLINARNQLSTITATTTSERQQQQEQMGQQQTEHMLSITRDLNQINLKSSLYAEQQVHNTNNNNKHYCRDNNQQEQQQQNSLSTNVSSDNNKSSSNNKHSNAGNNNNRQKQQQQTINCNNNSSNKDCDQAIDKNKNSKNTHTLAHNNRRIMKSYDNNNNNKPQSQQQQQQLITLTIAKAVQTETNALVSEKISTTTKVNTTTTTTTTAPTTTIERAKAKSAKLTLRKSFSTPASFKIADVAAAMSQSGGNMMIAYNNNNNSRASESYSKSVSKTLPKSELKSDSDGGGGDVVGGGGGHVRDAATCKMQPATQSVVAAPKVNFAPSPAIITKATQRANASIEAITTIANTTTTTKTSTTTAISASPQLATMDVVTRSQTAAHASQQQDPPQQRQLQQQQQQQLQQQQYQQSSTKSVKAKDNDNQVICANKSISDDDNVVVVAGTTTTSSPLPLSPVSFDLDLRFGCAHYKRRAMFVTPCCNKFYKCRFCHDENESHHFDRKTLTELICSECNTRQKVQEQCEACGTRFGKYTCLICNLFDDTDKKQYHCNGCGICRIGGAENFFHCKVCDMCLPIRLKIDGHRCVENISRSHCPVCLGDIHTSRIPCHIPDCGHLLHKTCFDQLLNSGHYTCPICQTSLIDMTALWEYLDAQAVSLPVPKKYENQRIHIFCNDCHKTSKTKFNFIGLKCMQCGAYNTTQDVKRRMSLVTDEPSSA